ncbi:unnamed protein product [Lactuca virosa]|uniref:Ribosomal protein L20 n=1 Tax=Lactuca virosa TaxID=75947 RepID=A0AAU9LNP2_9ASTR|nr:unnamed protein product [Lactuca virosa]
MNFLSQTKRSISKSKRRYLSLIENFGLDLAIFTRVQDFRIGVQSLLQASRGLLFSFSMPKFFEFLVGFAVINRKFLET